MSKSLLLKLKGPLQSWGTESRFNTRQTNTEPSKSAIVGLIAAAQGRRRTDDIEDLAELMFGVRTDQPGILVRDFQTAQHPTTDKYPRITHRYYLSDAVFVAAISAEQSLLEGIAESLHNPAFPLYLGRRACALNHDFLLGLRDGNVEESLRAEPWHAAKHHRVAQGKRVFLPISRDAFPNECPSEELKDTPRSFDSANRQYLWRSIVRPEPLVVENEDGKRRINDPIFEAVDE